MNRESEQQTRRQMRAGVTGENVLRPLDEFSVSSKPSTPLDVAACVKQWRDEMESKLFTFGTDTSAQIDPSTLALARQAVVWKDRV